MQKRSPKDASPTLPANPKEGSLLRREHAEKQQTNKKTTMIAESWRCSAEKTAEHVTNPNTPRAPTAQSGFFGGLGEGGWQISGKTLGDFKLISHALHPRRGAADGK